MVPRPSLSVRHPSLRVTIDRYSQDMTVPDWPTATNRPTAAPHATFCHALPPGWPAVAGVVAMSTHVEPSADTIARNRVGEAVEDELTAMNRPNSADQHTPFHVSFVTLAGPVQVIPSGEVIVRVLLVATAQNRASCGDQHTSIQPLDEPTAVWVVQVVPSGEVMTRDVASPVDATAQNRPSAGDQHTDRHVTPVIEPVWPVQLIPSGDVMTFVVPVPTTQNRPSAGDQHAPCQTPEGAVRAVHVVPFVDE